VAISRQPSASEFQVQGSKFKVNSAFCLLIPNPQSLIELCVSASLRFKYSNNITLAFSVPMSVANSLCVSTVIHNSKLIIKQKLAHRCDGREQMLRGTTVLRAASRHTPHRAE
jgi:hypothetical protein